MRRAGWPYEESTTSTLQSQTSRLPSLSISACSGPSASRSKADGGEHRYYDVGIEHLAFAVEDRGEVDDAYQRCVSMGAPVHCPPEEEHDLEGYYAFFAFDPDGIRVEVCSWTDQLREQWDAAEWAPQES